MNADPASTPPTGRIRAFLRHGRRLVIFVIGMTILVIGLLLILLPGPGIPIAIGGLAILGIEFAWARYWLRRSRLTSRRVGRSLRRRFGRGRPRARQSP